MNRIFFSGAVFFLITANITFAYTDGDYAVNKIPAVLLKNADAVVRDYDMHLTIHSLDNVEENLRYTITILNKNAYNESRLEEEYDKLFNDVDNISATLYDKDGIEVKSLKKRDILETSPFYNYLLFDNVKMKSYDFNYSDYPFTVAFEINTTHKETFWMPDFEPQKNVHCSVEMASLEVEYAKNIPLRYKTFHLEEKPALTEDGEFKKLALRISGINAEKIVELNGNDQYSFPQVIFACDEFEFADIPGRMDSWHSFGKFFYDLNANRDDLTDDMKKTVHHLTDTCRSDHSKINVLYRYLQGSTRYVAVELGVGGWQCLDAKDVCDSKYADCKGLSNYMRAMLKEAGIVSYGVLIYGGRDNTHKMLNEFPTNCFNHYILCVPQKEDTVWMDCTSTTDPAGYLSSFTSNRNALLLMPDGGYVVRTPAYTSKENFSVRNVDIHINGQDKMDAVLKLNYSGLLCDMEKGYVLNRPSDEVEQHFNNKLSLPAYKTTVHKIMAGVNGNIPTLYEEINITGGLKMTHTDKRLFIDPVILSMPIFVPSNNEPRTKPFHISSSYSICDTEVISIDGAYTAEFIPEEVSISKLYASYNCKLVFENDHIIKVFRSYTQTKGAYPADEFNDYCALAKSVVSGQKQVVLLKK